MKFRQIILFMMLAVGLALLILNLFFNNLFPSFSYSLLFWWLLFFYISCAWNFSLDSGFTLWVAFILFLISSLLTLLNLGILGEFILRLSLIAWIIGLIQALKEYCKNN